MASAVQVLFFIRVAPIRGVKTAKRLILAVRCLYGLFLFFGKKIRTGSEFDKETVSIK